MHDRASQAFLDSVRDSFLCLYDANAAPPSIRLAFTRPAPSREREQEIAPGIDHLMVSQRPGRLPVPLPVCRMRLDFRPELRGDFRT